jgi:aspartate racemase
MKHIGIVACSAEGAALCYREICRLSLDLVGKNDHPRVTMDSIPLAAWMPSFEAGDDRGVARFMLASARLLAAAGADFAICPDNSAHRAWDHVQAETPIPWLHIARVVGAEAAKRGYRRVGVLGTRFTMDGPVYRAAFSSLGIETMVPEASDFETVDRIIFAELVDGVFTDASRRIYDGVIARLRDRGCDAVALACTEIPLLVRPEESPLPALDSTRLLAAAAVHEARGGVDVALREATEDDLPIFFAHQRDADAVRMAALPARAWDAFVQHWRVKVLGDTSVRKKTIVAGGHVAGNVVSWAQDGRRLVGYWIGKEHWGRGVATAALSEFLRCEATRPLHAWVAVQNVGSIRVLEKCGFRRAGGERAKAPDGVEEDLFRLDRAPSAGAGSAG